MYCKIYITTRSSVRVHTRSVTGGVQKMQDEFSHTILHGRKISKQLPGSGPGGGAGGAQRVHSAAPASGRGGAGGEPLKRPVSAVGADKPSQAQAGALQVFDLSFPIVDVEYTRSLLPI